MRKVNICPPINAFLYRSIIGCLRYLVNTRPDLAYSVGVMSQYMEAPTVAHMTTIKQILRYVRGTINFGCCYLRKKRSSECLIGYSGSDLAGDIDDRKSTTRVIYFLGGNPATWFVIYRKWWHYPHAKLNMWLL